MLKSILLCTSWWFILSPWNNSKDLVQYSSIYCISLLSIIVILFILGISCYNFFIHSYFEVSLYNQPVETVKDYPSIPSLCIYICSTIWYEVQHFINDTVKSRASIPTIMRELAHWDTTKNSLQYHHTSYELLNKGWRLFTIIFYLNIKSSITQERKILKWSIWSMNVYRHPLSNWIY